MPTGGINEKNLVEYLSFKKIVACGGSWMVPADAVAAKDWNRITELTRSAVNLMLGLELRHVGVNSGSPEAAMRDAQLFCKLLGWQVKEGNSSVFAGNAFEMMKNPSGAPMATLPLPATISPGQNGIWSAVASPLRTRAPLP